MSDAAAAVGKDIYNLDVSELLKDGVVQICGLTPTDIMHITGDFDRYSKEASLLGAEFAAFNLGISVDELCERVYTEVKRKIYINIVKAMLENKYEHYMKNGVPPEIETLIDESFQEALTGSRDSLFSMMIKTRYSLVGIGAAHTDFSGRRREIAGNKCDYSRTLRGGKCHGRNYRQHRGDL